VIENDSIMINEFYMVEDLYDVEWILCSDFFLVITKENSCFVWGGDSNSFCPYKKPFFLTEFENKILEADIGSNFAVLIDMDLIVYTCGKNDKG